MSVETLKNKFWGTDKSPFIIAEMSGNHNQSLEKALEIVDAAASTGASAIKMQTFTEDSMTIESEEEHFQITDPKSLWAGQSLYNLYKTAKTPFEWHQPIIERAKSHGLICFSSPFDEAAVDFLETLDVPAYKIASFECVDLPLISKAASTGKPLIISTGMANLAEISEAVEAARSAGCRDLVLLKCTSTYPASAENTNLRTISKLRELFNCEVGLSDHTMGVGASVAAIAFGASVIEKHFTLDRDEGGVDAAFSLEPAEFKSLVQESNTAWKALGEVKFGPTVAEEKARTRRRSIYITEDMEKGEVFTTSNLRRIRPGHGLPPKYYNELLGKRVSKSVKKGTPMQWHLI